MDYDNPQFVAAIKKILGSLTSKAENNDGSESEQANPQEEIQATPPIAHEFYVSDSTIDRIKAPTADEKRREWWKDFIEVTGIGVLILYTMFAYFQWKELNTANINQSAANIESTAVATNAERQIRQNATDTHVLAEAAKDQAAAALSQARASESLARNAKQSLDASIAASQLDERPWIGMKSQAVEQFDVNGMSGHIEFFNSGKTPARKIRYGVAFESKPLPMWDGPPDQQVDSLELHGNDVLAPQSQFSFNIPADASGRDRIKNIFAVLLPAINAEMVVVYVYGAVKYDDVNDRTHTTTFCLYAVKMPYGPSTWQLAHCKGFNKMD